MRNAHRPINHPAFFYAERSTRMSRNARRPTDRVPPRSRESAKTLVIPRRAHLASTALWLLNRSRHQGLRVALRTSNPFPSKWRNPLTVPSVRSSVECTSAAAPARSKSLATPSSRSTREGSASKAGPPGQRSPPGTSDRTAGPGCRRRAAPGNMGDRDRDDRGSGASHSAVSRRGTRSACSAAGR